MWNALQDVVAAVTADSDEELDYTSELDTSQVSTDGIGTPKPSMMSSMLQGAATLLSDDADQIQKSIPSFDIGLPIASSVPSKISREPVASVPVTAPQSPETPAMASTRHRGRTGTAAAATRRGNIPPTTPTQIRDSISHADKLSAEPASTPGVTGPTPSKPIVIHSPQIQPGSLAMHAQGPVTFETPPKRGAELGATVASSPERQPIAPTTPISTTIITEAAEAIDTTISMATLPQQKPVIAPPRRRADSEAFDGLRTAYASVKAELAASRAHAVSVEAELCRIKADLCTVTAQRDSAIKQVRESETRLEEAEEDADTAEAEVDRLGAELSRVKEEHETASKLSRESLQEALASASAARDSESRTRQILWQLEAQEAEIAGGDDKEEAAEGLARIKAVSDDDEHDSVLSTPKPSPVLAIASQYEAEELRRTLADRDLQLHEARSDAEEAGQALGKLHTLLRAESVARSAAERCLEETKAALRVSTAAAEKRSSSPASLKGASGSSVGDPPVVAKLQRERAEALMTLAGVRGELSRVTKQLNHNQRMYEELREASVERRVVGRLLVEWIARPDKRRDVAHLMAGMLALSPREQQLVRAAAGDDTMAVPTSAGGDAATDVVASTDSFFGFARALSEFVAEAAAERPPGMEPVASQPVTVPNTASDADKLVLRLDSV